MSERVFHSEPRPISRRLFIGGAVALALTPEVVLAQEKTKIVPVEYNPSKGLHRGYYWMPMDGSLEGEEATGFNEGGPWDKYDKLDRLINGSRARSVYWPAQGGPASTRDWLIAEAFRILHGKGQAAYEAKRTWTGYCMDAAAASYFAPKIEGSMPVAGIEFSERDRMIVAAHRWGGLARTPVNTASQELIDKINNGDPVVVNHTIDGISDWWGIATRVDEVGRIVINRGLKWNESGLEETLRYPSELKGAFVLDENNPEPGRLGNYSIVDRKVGGLIIGTHKLAA